MGKYTFEEIETFFNSFKNYKQSSIVLSINQYNDFFENWNSQIYSQIPSAYFFSGPEYNIFSIIKIRKLIEKEEEVHTPIIANLLNPRGSHRQENIFYDAFIKNCLKDEIIYSKFIPADYSKLFVNQEVTTAFGKLDVFISYYSHSNSFAICIENKIYGQDKENQLYRYYNFLRSNYKRFCLIYLTPKGHLPSVYSINHNLRTELQNAKQLFIVSYRNEVTQTLRDTIPKITSNRVSGFMEQYLTTINTL